MLHVKLSPTTSPTERREVLAEAICDWVLEHGVGNLSLRPLARDLGTSTYSLMYWFGSKEGVVSAALERSEQRQQGMVFEWVATAGDVAPGDLLRRYWAWSASEQGRPYLRLIVELQGLAQRSAPLRAYVERALAPWRHLIEPILEASGLDPQQARDRTTLLFATISGLQTELATGGDVERTTRAAELLASELDTLGRLSIAEAERHLATRPTAG